MLVEPVIISPSKNSPREDNKLRPTDRAAHDWYRFVLSYPPHVVREYLDRFGITPGARVLDPFCGTGTTLVECKKLGIESVGIEANPFAHFAAGVKCDWSVSSSRLELHAEAAAKSAARRLREEGLPEPGGPLFDGAPSRSPTPLQSFDKERTRLLLKNSISPIPLHRLLTLRNILNRGHAERLSAHELLALARTAVFRASNLHFGPEVGLGQIKDDAAVVGPWLHSMRQMAADIRALRPMSHVKAEVIHGDSRSMLGKLPPRSIDAVITSPPYPNEKDYTRTTRLELVLLGFASNMSDIRALKKTLVRSNTRSVYRADQDDQFVGDHEAIQAIAREIERRRISMGKTSGFEKMYHRVTTLYFGGMWRHLAELRRVMKPGGHLAYVVGDQASYLRVMIRTGQLLADIASRLGYEVVAIDLFRTRLATATGEQLREEVVVLRWPGKGRKEWPRR